MDRLSIGNKIKELRTKAGFNQTIIAEYLQVDQSLISKIEKGEREASTDQALDTKFTQAIKEEADARAEKVQELSGSDMAHWLKMKPEEKKLNSKLKLLKKTCNFRMDSNTDAFALS